MAFFTKWWCLLLVALSKLTHSLKDVTLQIEPRIVRRGEEATLICTYDLESDPLYAVKWYRGNREFYRYTPSNYPNIKVFLFGNINIDLDRSDGHRVVIRDVDFALSGNFSCEVTTEAPSFLTAYAYEQMYVVVFPEDAPSLTTEKSTYEVGDTLKAKCKSGPSRPATTLTFLLNNMVVCKHCETTKYHSGDLFYSELLLLLPLFPKHFSDGQLKLRCSAQIVDLYQRDTDVFLFREKEPIPERVMSASTASTTASPHIFTAINISILFLCGYTTKLK